MCQVLRLQHVAAEAAAAAIAPTRVYPETRRACIRNNIITLTIRLCILCALNIIIYFNKIIIETRVVRVLLFKVKIVITNFLEIKYYIGTYIVGRKLFTRMPAQDGGNGHVSCFKKKN